MLSNMVCQLYTQTEVLAMHFETLSQIMQRFLQIMLFQMLSSMTNKLARFCGWHFITTASLSYHKCESGGDALSRWASF